MKAFTLDDFLKLAYLPYNTQLASFVANVGVIADMRTEQAAECAHRTAKLMQHSSLLDLDTWKQFHAWVDTAERSLIDQIDQALCNGDLLIPLSMPMVDPAALRICMMPVPNMGTFRAPRVSPRWVQRSSGRELVIDQAPGPANQFPPHFPLN
mgnify:CR=1 FL=1